MKPVVPLALVLVCVLLLLPACSALNRSASPSPTPTESVEPTTPEPATVTGPDNPTAAAVSTSAPPSPGQITGSVTDLLNVRGGPGLNYPVKAQLKQGDTITIIGKSADGLWWQYSGGWVSATYVQVSGDATAVPVTTPAASP